MWFNQTQEEQNPSQNEDDTSNFFDFPKVPLWKQYLYDRRVQGIIFLTIAAVLMPTLLMFFIGENERDVDRLHTCSVIEQYRVPCGKQKTTFDKCTEINCCYEKETKGCYHFLPSKYSYSSSGKWLNNGALDRRTGKTPFGIQMYPKIYLSLTEKTENIISISIRKNQTETIQSTNINTGYVSSVNTEYGTVSIMRNDSKQTLLTTARGPLIASERFWEWTIDLEAEQLYGMDEMRFSENKTTTKIVYSNAKSHAAVVKFMAYSRGMFHGISVEHPGLLEVSVLPSRLIAIKMLSGDELTINLCIGPTPKDVFDQLQHVQIVIPPLWMLGVHICRDGKMSISEALQEFYKFDRKLVSFSYDSDCLHGDMFSLTMDALKDEILNITTAVKLIRQKGKAFFMSLSPQVRIGNFSAYTKAKALNILYEHAGSILNGTYLEQTVAFPDMRGDDAHKWYRRMYAKLPVDGDAFVLKNDWPENSNYSMSDGGVFQYMTDEIRVAMSGTIPWNAKSHLVEEHVLDHNNYGQEYADAMANTKTNTYILSASHNNYYRYGSHIQNLNLSWVNFERAVKLSASSGLFVNYLTSIPVCGSTRFYDVDQEELCVNWYKAASFMPLFRISSEAPWRDPTGFQLKQNEQIAVKAIQVRYTLLPYLQTLLFERTPIFRPMFYDYYKDNESLVLNEQFMVGDGILTSFPFLPGVEFLNVYLPAGRDWFEFWGGHKLNNGWNVMSYLNTDFIMLLASGKIIVLHQAVNATTISTRLEPWRFAVALNCTKEKCFATGKLCLDVSVCLDINYKYRTDTNTHNVTITNINQSKKLMCGTSKVSTSVVGSMTVYGISSEILYINNLDLDLCKCANSWSDSFKI